MSETNDEVKNEQTIDEAVDKVPETDEVFKDKPENETEDETTAESTTEDETLKPETEEQREEAIEKKTVEEEEPEPLYQRKVYIVDLNNVGLKIDGKGTLIVDVMSINKDTQKATVKNGDLTIEIPKEFLFNV